MVPADQCVVKDVLMVYVSIQINVCATLVGLVLTVPLLVNVMAKATVSLKRN